MKRVLAIGVLVCALTGCGTAGNFRGDPLNATPYGGVQIAVDDFETGKQGTTVLPVVVWPMRAADVALSAVADTVTLPVTVPLYLLHVEKALREQNPPLSAPERKRWREFWFNDQPPTTRIEGGIY